MKNSKLFRNSAWSLLGLLFGSAANAQSLEPPIPDIKVNFVGLVVGSVPDYSGSKDNTGAVGPILRYQFKDSERYFLWLGPTLTLNLVNDQTWRAGPMLNYRSERGDDVEDEVVKRMDKVDAKLEVGAFLQYRLKLSPQPLHQVLFTGDVAGSENGTVAHLRAMYYQPFSDQLIGSIGLGTTFGDDKFARTYYGVRSANDIALFNGQRYDASGGFLGVNIPFGVTWIVKKQWLLTAGARYEKLMGDAKDSPIVTDRGKSSQWMYGIAASYMF